MPDFRSWWRKSLKRAAGPVCVALLVGVALPVGTVASAQGYDESAAGDPRTQRDPRDQRDPRAQRDPRDQGSPRDQRCKDLERQLVSDWQLSNNPRDSTANIDQQLGEYERARRRAEGEAEQRVCYEDMFLFGRSLKRTPTCIRLDEEIENARRNIRNLQQQRDALTNNANRRMRRDDLVDELARAGCGESYARENETRRRSSSIFSLWEDEGEDSFDRGYANQQPEQSNLPFASYRTMCVRLCDGYYFPISFSTLESRFKEDDSKCRDQCAAPAELFIYRNPGEDIEQMVSLDGKPYTGLKTAFLNRKRYVKGCSCKPEEYSVQEIEQSEKALGKQANVKAAGAPSPERGGDGSAAPSGDGAKGDGKP